MANLITSARAKQNINQASFTTAEDSTIDSLIDAVSKAVKRYCRRELDLQTFDALFSGTGDTRLILHEYPITSVSRVATSPQTVLRVKNAGSNQRATVRITSTGLNLVTVASGVTTTETEITWASNSTITAVKNAVIAKGNGWTAEVTQPDFALWDSEELAPAQGAFNLDSSVQPHGALQAMNQWAPFRIWTKEVSDFDIDSGRGMLLKGHRSGSGWTVGFHNYRVTYTAGYSTVPEDVQEATAQWVASLFWQTKDNPAVYPDFPSTSIAIILDHYRRCGS